ncbi:hypothetical protein HGM15179_022406, partial [Zosterops borbonicus]
MLLEGDTVTLRCWVMWDMSVTRVRFYQDKKDLGQPLIGTELSLSPLQLNHSGHYHCRGLVDSKVSQRWQDSVPVTVTVHGEHPTSHTSTPPQPLSRALGSPWPPIPLSFPELFMVPVLEGPSKPIEESPLNLSCLSTPSPLRPPAPLLHLFYRDRQLVGGPQGSPQLLVPAVGVSHSGNYSCQVHSEGGNVQKGKARLRVTVH